MAIERARLTVVAQMARQEASRFKGLAVRVKDPRTGYIMKAAKLFAMPVEQRRLIDPSLVEARTPLGILLNPAVILLTPDEIDRQAAAIDAAFEVASPRRVIIPELVIIPAGTFPVPGSQLFGSERQTVDNISMSGFKAGKYPVTVAEFRAFVDATGYEITGQGAEELKALLADTNKDRHPVVYINRADREAYKDWTKKTTGENWFILSAAQQEFIRRGAEERAYPWGNDWRQLPHFNTNQTAAVDAWPQGVTPEGVSGLGIVWEATRSWFGNYDPKITQDPEGPETGANHEVRGGSAWSGGQGVFGGVDRGDGRPGDRNRIIGFRLGRDL